MKRYRVAWKSTTTGATGAGEWMDSKSIAEAFVADGNSKHSEIDHWVEEYDEATDTE